MIVVSSKIWFDFVLHYYPGKFMNKPDILSQISDHDDSSYNNGNMILINLEYLVVYEIEELAFKRKRYNFLTNIY